MKLIWTITHLDETGLDNYNRGKKQFARMWVGWARVFELRPDERSGSPNFQVKFSGEIKSEILISGRSWRFWCLDFRKVEVRWGFYRQLLVSSFSFRRVSLGDQEWIRARGDMRLTEVRMRFCGPRFFCGLRNPSCQFLWLENRTTFLDYWLD